MSENRKNVEKVIAPRTRLAREKVMFVYNLLIRSDYEGALRRDVGHILGPSALSPVRDKFFPITSDDLLAEDQGRCSCFVGTDFSTPLQSLVKGRKVTKSRAPTGGSVLSHVRHRRVLTCIFSSSLINLMVRSGCVCVCVEVFYLFLYHSITSGGDDRSSSRITL